jgi:hypothetical protein
MADEKITVIPTAAYFNVMRVSHNRREFFFDFAQAGVEPGVANLLTRMITSPGHAKAMLAAMVDNVRKYEEKFGEIEPTSGAISPGMQ